MMYAATCIRIPIAYFQSIHDNKILMGRILIVYLPKNEDTAKLVSSYEHNERNFRY